MLLCSNIGNSIISFGFFNDVGEMFSSFNISSDIKRTSDEYLAIIKNITRDKDIKIEKIDGVILSSVVPQLTEKLKKALSQFSGTNVMVVGPGVKTGFHIKIDNPSELGADMVANTAAAIRMKKENNAVIVADLGIVNTLSAISKNNEYLGCAIFPGVQLSFDALHGKTAQLPNVVFPASINSIGKNSQSSLRSGVILGDAMIVDGLVQKFADEMKISIEEIELIATGEYAQMILDNCKKSFVYKEDLTLNGLYSIYKINVDNNR